MKTPAGIWKLMFHLWQLNIQEVINVVKSPQNNINDAAVHVKNYSSDGSIQTDQIHNETYSIIAVQATMKHPMLTTHLINFLSSWAMQTGLGGVEQCVSTNSSSITKRTQMSKCIWKVRLNKSANSDPSLRTFSISTSVVVKYSILGKYPTGQRSHTQPRNIC